jgi:NDP-sugar pyrophosphorylase family protein
MDILIKRLLAESIPVPKYNIQEYWLDIGRIGDYEKAQDAYETHFKNSGDQS